MTTAEKFCEFGLAVIDIEERAVKGLKERIDEHFAKACELLFRCEGRVIVTGLGKSGHIGGKIAATLASTGTPSFFVHPGEANHGDMGMITPKDLVLAISNSGETAEILNMLPLIKRLGIPLVCLSGKANSNLAKAATVYLNTSITEEACPLGLAPTSSTTATLVMGDALAIALLQARGFTAEDFALYHPGGVLGRRLLLRIEDIMHTDPSIPKIAETASLNEALLEMTQKRLGMTTIINTDNQLVGVYTDGDLRRTLHQGLDIHSTKMKDVMTKNCKTAFPDMLAAEALRIMEDHKITSLTVVDSKQRLLGVVHLHDLLSAGLS